MAVYQKAYICPFRNGRPELGKKFFVQFNPTELSIEEAIGVEDQNQEEPEQEKKKLLRGSRIGI